MSRRDYELIAAAIAAARSTVVASRSLSTPEQGVGIVVSYLAEALAEDNPKFNTERFIAATGEQ